jgi:pullulanase/glycogen debranching enzyme
MAICRMSDRARSTVTASMDPMSPRPGIASTPWNCGAEGPADDKAIIELRNRQKRNMLATLLFSQGTPMLLGGDEFGRTQQGNNNAYCQDAKTERWSGMTIRRDVIPL